ncbi:response regulator [Granulosicoccus sp. 3-233]|uniref:response regulator n=1 Tax=Granulosicoccus sp. 3-233 TaxID=3417969 RepID=UPI003D3599FD
MIPVAIVDDGEADRYLVKRRLARSGKFEELIEFSSGDRFLDEFSNGVASVYTGNLPLLILMDINMPGRDGFQTIEELSLLVRESGRPDNTLILMYTSSLNIRDQERAKELSIIKGYLAKPMRNDSVERMEQIYRACCAA